MNIRQSVATATCITLLAAPFSALAGGFFVGGSIGKANLNEDFDGLNVDTDSTSYRITAGWRFNEHFALEGGYHNFGDFEQSFDDDGTTIDAKLSADGFLFGAIGTIPLGERFALTARAGGFFWNGAAEINGVSQASPEDNNLYLGAGARFNVTERFGVTGDWTRYELESATSKVFAIGIDYRFGK
jgi:OOP family OmpA-OmpF porin